MLSNWSTDVEISIFAPPFGHAEVVDWTSTISLRLIFDRQHHIPLFRMLVRLRRAVHILEDLENDILLSANQMRASDGTAIVDFHILPPFFIPQRGVRGFNLSKLQIQYSSIS